jgi:hypothetical protein
VTGATEDGDFIEFLRAGIGPAPGPNYNQVKARLSTPRLRRHTGVVQNVRALSDALLRDRIETSHA